MSNELHADYDSGKNIYACIFNGSGQVDYVVGAGGAFENWGTSSHDADDYDITLTEVGTGGSRYVGSFDTNISVAGIYTVIVFEKVGANPADGDPRIAQGEIWWSGSAEITLYSKLPSKTYLSGSTDSDGGIDSTEAAVVNAQVDTALSDIKLDHLIAVADSDDVVDNSIIAHLAASDGDWSGFDDATDSLEAIRDNQGTSADTALSDAGLDDLLVQSTVSDAAATTTSFDTALTEATDDHYNNLTLFFTDGALAGQARRITDYDGTDKTITVYPAFTDTPSDGEAFSICSSAYYRIPGAGALEITYTVKEDDEDTGDPIDGVEVWISTDITGTNVIWNGTTNASGVLLESGSSKPFLDAGTYYFWRRKSGYTFTNPDTETFS